MNEHFDSDSSEPEIEEVMSRLRELQPNIQSRVAIRQIVATEVQRNRTVAPIWRRTIAIPVPLVAALLIAVVASVAVVFASREETEGSTVKIDGARSLEASREQKSADPDVHHTGAYLCGIGTIDFQSRYLYEGDF